MNILTSIKTKSKKAVKPVLASTLALGAAVGIGSTSAHAAVADMFTAADISGLSTNVEALLTTFIGIMLLFVGYKYLKRGFNRG